MESFISSIPHLISEFTSELEMGRRIVTLAKRRRIELENLSSHRRQHENLQQEVDDGIDDGGVSLVDQAISVLLISKEIFRHLSDEDLLQCSLVNKIWNFSARYELREQDRKCFACIGGDKPCKSLTEFVTVVLHSTNPPFNGLSFSNTVFSGASSTSDDSSSSSDSESFHRNPDDEYDYTRWDKHVCIDYKKNTPRKYRNITSLCHPIFDAFKIKHLRLSWEKEPKLNCFAMNLISHIINEKSKDLVGLTMDQLPRSATDISKYFGFEKIPRQSKLSSEVKKGNRTEEVAKSSGSFHLHNDELARQWLPNVKVLDLPAKRWSWGWESNPIPIVKDLIVAMPRLESIQGYVSLEFLPAVLQLKKTYCVHHFAFELIKFRYGALILNQHVGGGGIHQDQQEEDYDLDQLLDFGLKFAKEEPRLRKLMISTSFSALTIFQAEALSQLKFKTSFISSQLLKSSCNFLTELWINHLDLVLLATNLPPLAPVNLQHSFQLTRLRHLTIELHEEIDQILGFTSIYRVDFASIFPVLESIQIRCRRYFMMREDVHPYISPSFRQLNSNYVCETVRKLVISGEFKGYNVRQCMRDYSKLFPNVKSLVADMYDCMYFEEFCESLWIAWPDLESIRFHGVKDLLIKANLDPYFTGLSRQDCDTLLCSKHWNFEDFKELQFKPSLLNLTKLRLFQLEIHHVDNCERSKTLNKVFLSELTGRCVLERMPNLSVEIERYTCDCDEQLKVKSKNKLLSNLDCNKVKPKSHKCRFEMDHLRPFVKFVLGFDDW